MSSLGLHLFRRIWKPWRRSSIDREMINGLEVGVYEEGCEI
jgi:hypothetical protein